MPERPIRLGVSVGRPRTGSTWAQTAREIETIGFHSMWVADHLVDDLYSPFAALAWAAASTERLVVGPLVLANDFRHPVIVAREAATLAELSGGRFVLGLGAGHMRFEYEEAGIAYDDDATRVDRFVEAVEVIDALRGGGSVDHAGRHYRVKGHHIYPATRFPLLVGGNGRRVLTTAARRADIVQFTGFSPRDGGTRNDLGNMRSARLDRQVAEVRAEAGGRPIELSALVQRMTVTDDPAGATAATAAQFGVPVEAIRDCPYIFVGKPEQIADLLHERSERFGITSWIALSLREGIDGPPSSLAPVIARLS